MEILNDLWSSSLWKATNNDGEGLCSSQPFPRTRIKYKTFIFKYIGKQAAALQWLWIEALGKRYLESAQKFSYLAVS